MNRKGFKALEKFFNEMQAKGVVARPLIGEDGEVIGMFMAPFSHIWCPSRLSNEVFTGKELKEILANETKRTAPSGNRS